MSLARSQHASISQNHTSPLRYGKNKFPKPLRENPNHRFIEGERFGLHDCGGWQIKGLDCRMGVLGWWWVATLRSQGDGRSDLTFVVMAPMKCVYLHCLHPSNLISHSQMVAGHRSMVMRMLFDFVIALIFTLITCVGATVFDVYCLIHKDYQERKKRKKEKDKQFIMIVFSRGI